jgi:hypothetical protein
VGAEVAAGFAAGIWKRYRPGSKPFGAFSWMLKRPDSTWDVHSTLLGNIKLKLSLATVS